jgi:hypothetical protein
METTYPKCYFNAKRLCFIKRLSENQIEFIFLQPFGDPTDTTNGANKLFKPYHFKKEKTESQNIDEFVKDTSKISLEDYQAIKNNLIQYEETGDE